MKLGKLLITMLVGAPLTTARANQIGNDTQNFNPVTSGLDFVTVQGTETLQPGVVNFGYFLNGARNVLPNGTASNGVYIDGGNVLGTQDLNLGYGLTDTLDAGLNISSLLYQTTERTGNEAEFAKTGLDEIRANVKWNLRKRDPLGLAFITSINFNQVKNNPFLGEDPGTTFNFELATDYKAGDYLYAFNLGYRVRNSGRAMVGSMYKPLSDQIIASVAASRYVTSLDAKFIVEVYAAQEVSPSANEADQTAAEALVGVKWDVTPAIAVHAGAGAKLTDGLFAPDQRVYVGLNYTYDLFPHAKKEEQVTRVNVATGYQPNDIEAFAKQSFDELTDKHEFVLRRSVPDKPDPEQKAPFEVVRLDGLDFNSGSSDILPKHRPIVEKLVSFLNAKPEVIKIRIEGHTDSLGREEKNRALSSARSVSIRKYLEQHGLNKSIPVEVVGYGSAKPIADNGNFQGRALNRRVEVRILRRINLVESQYEMRQEK